MDFEYSPKVKDLMRRVDEFMQQHVYPIEHAHDEFVQDPANRWQQPPIVEELKAKARAAGLWNLFLPHEYGQWSPGLTNLEYAPLAELHGSHRVGAGSLQLQRARHRQHGSARALRHARAAGALAQAAARRARSARPT